MTGVGSTTVGGTALVWFLKLSQVCYVCYEMFSVDSVG